MKALGMLGLALTILLSSTLAVGARSYPIVCRGGGTMRFKVISDSAGKRVLIWFKGATTGAGTGGTLEPGQCAWVDRGLAPSEPETLCHRIGAGFEIEWGAQSQRVTSVAGWDVPYLSALASASGYQIFQAHNTRTCLTVDRLGP